ncbi:MAG TPA: YigZ family protein [Anaerovoracaceae bacterium]|nr:YigZ family protein [Anaerovoracaceae bacterium]
MIRYRSIKKKATVEQVIERSRFIGHASPVETKEEALDFFSQIRDIHKAATHNVPAFVIGEKSHLLWASDDGEPQGTSGPPILQMIVREGITNIAVIVTRYFGGIKLGTGGLVRAYTTVAKAAIDAAKICDVREMNILTVKLDYGCLGKLQNLAAGDVFSIDNIIYEDKVTMDILSEPEKQDETMEILSSITGGQFDELGMRQELVKT